MAKQRKLSFYLNVPKDEDEKCATSSSTASTEDSEESSSKLKRKTVRKVTNLEAWKKDFTWFKYDSAKHLMFCTICTENCGVHPKRNAFITGSNNYQRSALIRHEESSEHRACCRISQEKVYRKTAEAIAKEKYEPILVAQMKTCAFMIRENIADRKFSSLIDLQVTSKAHQRTILNNMYQINIILSL